MFARWFVAVALAAPLFAQAVTLADQHLSPSSRMRSQSRFAHGNCLVRLKQFDKAETQLKAALDGFTAARGKDHPSTREVIAALAILYKQWDKPQLARAYDRMLARPATVPVSGP